MSSSLFVVSCFLFISLLLIPLSVPDGDALKTCHFVFLLLQQFILLLQLLFDYDSFIFPTFARFSDLPPFHSCSILRRMMFLPLLHILLARKESIEFCHFRIWLLSRYELVYAQLQVVRKLTSKKGRELIREIIRREQSCVSVCLFSFFCFVSGSFVGLVVCSFFVLSSRSSFKLCSFLDALNFLFISSFSFVFDPSGSSGCWVESFCFVFVPVPLFPAVWAVIRYIVRKRWSLFSRVSPWTLFSVLVSLFCFPCLVLASSISLPSVLHCQLLRRL